MLDTKTCQNDEFIQLNIIDKPSASYTIAINIFNKILRRSHSKLYSQGIDNELRRHNIDEQYTNILRILQFSFEGKDIGEKVKYINSNENTIGVLEDFQISDEPVIILPEAITIRERSNSINWHESHL